MVYPGDAPPEINHSWITSSGHSLRFTHLNACCHISTHLDSPAHFLKEGRGVADIPLTDLIGPTQVMDLTGKRVITASDLEDRKPLHAHRLFLKTDNSGRLRDPGFSPDHVYLDRSAIDLLVRLAPPLLGFDHYSVDDSRLPALDGHFRLAEADIPVVVFLDLLDVPAGTYFGSCLPILIDSAEAAPARVVLTEMASAG
jgi:arylformamidase